MNLKENNTFGFSVYADQVYYLECKKDIEFFFNITKKKCCILGNGSNVVLCNKSIKTVAICKLKGKNVIDKENYIFLEIASGENWHDFVEWTINCQYPGLENLAFIPGTIGAAPIQNIGAYGVELKDVFYSLKAYDRVAESWHQLFRHDCAFSYRSSIFKKYPDRYFIASIVFILEKKWSPNLLHQDLQLHFAQIKKKDITPKMIFDAIHKIRTSKLPDPKIFGNVGSFFHNPIVNQNTYKTIKSQYFGIVAYPYKVRFWKLSAAWLIDQCGFKGYRIGQAGVYQKQPMVLINYGDSTGYEILNLAFKIQNEIKKKFHINLKIEPTIFF